MQIKSRLWIALLIALTPGCSDDGNESDADPATNGETDGETDGDEPDPSDPESGGEGQGYDVSEFDWEDPRPQTFHPLTQPQAKVLRSEEVAVIMADHLRNVGGWAIDDEVERGQELGTIAPSTLAQGQPQTAMSADVGGDGADEILTLIRTGAPGNRTATVSVVGRSPSFAPLGEFTIGGPTQDLGDLGLVTGDIDGDNRDEVIITAIDRFGGTAIGRVFIRDDAQQGFAALHEHTVASVDEIRATVGRLDTDDAQELVIATRDGDHVVAEVLDDANAGYAPLLTLTEGVELGLDHAEDQLPRTLLGLRLAAANIDDDPVDELVFAAFRRRDTGSDLVVAVHDDIATGSPELRRMRDGYIDSSTVAPGDLGWSVATGDLDANRNLELVSLKRDVYDFGWGYYLSHFDLASGEVRRRRVSDTVLSHRARAHFAVLDDDRDRRDEITVALFDDDSGIDLLQRQRWSLEFDTAYSLDRVALVDTIIDADSDPAPFVVGGDFDGDSLKVRYTGEKWLSLSRPQIAVVMAAAPVQADISQNYDFTETAFGSEVSMGTTEGYELGVRSNVSLSFESPDLLKVIGFEAGVALEQAFTSSHTNTSTVAYDTSYAGAGIADYVVFQGTLYTSYQYRIVAADDPAAIGTLMTIDEPVATKTFKWTVEYFNATIDDPAQHIGAELFAHTPGDLSTYRTAADMDRIVRQNDGWASPEVTAGQGLGTNAVEIHLSEEQVDTAQLTLSTTYSGGISVAGLGFGGSRTTSDGSIYEVSVGELTSYRGVVGDISDPGDYQAHNYAFGMYVHNAQRQDGARFQVIDYWVTPLVPFN